MRHDATNRMVQKGLAIVVVAGMALWSSCRGGGDDDNDGEVFQNPVELSSRNGELRSEFTVAMSEVIVHGKRLEAPLYNGLYIPPTLRVRRGDTVRLRLANGIDQQTNLHYHGMNLSPLGNSDNVFAHVLPSTFFDYELKIGPNHPEGLFYYHPHQYGNTESQIMGGMSGLLIVEGLLDPFPALANITERQIVLKDTQIVDGHVPDDIDPSGDTFHTLNGQVNPRIDIKPGELQLWRIGNIGADQYYHLELEGHVFYEIARDGNRHTHIVESTQLLLPPSSRSEVLVRGGPAGSSAFRSLDFETGPAGDSYPGVTLATLVSSGDPVDPIPLPAASAFPPVEDLRTVPNPNPRTIVFSETSDGNTFFINGKTFDENRVDTTVQFGTVEEWTLVNCSQELHVFHIHQLDFQVTEINGVAQPFVGYQDTINLPIATDENSDDENCATGKPSIVKVLIPFTEETNVGKFVYHCHIGEHEDNGMVATIEVVQPPAP